jgi:hypothetical protein
MLFGLELVEHRLRLFDCLRRFDDRRRNTRPRWRRRRRAGLACGLRDPISDLICDRPAFAFGFTLDEANEVIGQRYGNLRQSLGRSSVPRENGGSTEAGNALRR